MTMSSASATTACGILPMYGSSKAYVLQLSQSLQNAYPTNETGLVFHAFHPFFIKTAMTTRDDLLANQIPLHHYFYPDANQWMETALKVNTFRVDTL